MTTSTGAYVYVQPGVVELAGVAPTIQAAHGADITLDIGPTRLSHGVGDTRLSGTSIGATRTGSADIADTRITWVIAGSRPRGAAEVGDTRLGTQVADTRVQRNRS